MTSQHLETERTYDLPGEQSLPVLDVYGTHLGKVIEHSLVATYFDTDDLTLSQAGISLRRRTGGDDPGWHLKLPPTGDTRREIHRPLGKSEAIPPTLSQGLFGTTHGGRLQPIAQIKTTRAVRDLLDEAGQVLAKICDDQVTASRPDQVTASRAWREVEIELVNGSAALLDELEVLLFTAGVHRSILESKLFRTLGEALPAKTVPEPDGTAGGLLLSYVRHQVSALRVNDIDVRLGVGDGVHQMRVVARRLRSALASFRPLLRESRCRDLERELKWLAGELSETRDLEVLSDLFEAGIQEQPQGSPAARAVVKLELARTTQQGRARVMAALSSDRYLTLLNSLAALLDSPKWTPSAAQADRKVAAKRVSRARNRLRERVLAASVPSGHVRNERLHGVRKAAKRLRYAAEVAEPVLGKKAAKISKRAEDLQELLGDLNDTRLARQWLLNLGRTEVPGAPGFVFGRMYAEQEQIARRLEKSYDRRVSDLI